MTPEKHLDRIEAILDEIDRLQLELGFSYPDVGSREAHDVLSRIIRQRDAKRQVAAE